MTKEQNELRAYVMGPALDVVSDLTEKYRDGTPGPDLLFTDTIRVMEGFTRSLDRLTQVVGQWVSRPEQGGLQTN
jgi:hypothetical protein